MEVFMRVGDFMKLRRRIESNHIKGAVCSDSAMHCVDGLPHGVNKPEARDYIVYKLLGPLTVDLLSNPVPLSGAYCLGAVSMYERVSDALELPDGVAAHPLSDKIEGIGLQESRDIIYAHSFDQIER